MAHRLPGYLKKFHVQPFGFLFQAEIFQADGIGSEGRRIYNTASGPDIRPLKILKDLGMLQNPLFRGHAPRHPRFVQIGTGCPVQKQDSLFRQFLKFLFCH